MSDPILFLLHFLGGSARTWTEVAERLAPRRCVAIDLPGFGDAAGLGGRTVAEMADHVAAAVRAEMAGAGAPGRWALAGHSMGGKVAAVLARRAEDGEAGLEGLAAVVLVAASPAGPEPMAAAKREEMLGWFRGDAGQSAAEAEGFVRDNVGAALPAASGGRTVDDVVRADPAAWRAWLEQGAREDWAARVGVLRTPALVLAGGEDAALGTDAQRVLVAPAFARARLATLAGAGHLLPVERPEEVAGLIAAFLDEAAQGDGEAVAGVAGGPGPAWRALLGADRVSERTRAALLERARPDDPAAAPRAMSEAQRATLRLVVDRMVPQPAGVRIDLAARVDAVLAAGVGDGWRLAGAPPDAVLCRAGLDTLEAAARQGGAPGVAGLADAAQDALLGRAAAGTLDAGAGEGMLDAERMQLWFEEVRSTAVRAYVAHPATLARMGYSGIGYGGDGARLEGFVRLGIGAREDWEPVADGHEGVRS
ncbi:MAG: alpha/beta hydrolase [Janthinobacterium lividum]